MDAKQLLQRIVEVAGIFHDPGKANKPFVNKVWKGLAKADPIRHEIISMLMLERWYRERKTDTANSLTAPITIGNILKMDDGRTTALGAASWMVATHHRLLCPSYPGSTPQAYTLANHAEEGAGCTVEIRKDLADLKFLKALSELDTESLNEDLGPELYASVCFYGRLALILADHKVSSQPFDPEWNRGKRPPKNSLVANTERVDGKVVGRQGLAEHNIKVSRETRHTVDDVIDAPGLVRSLKSTDLPAIFHERSQGRFEWQNKAVDVIRESRAKGGLQGGFFAVLAAGTGCGKTIGTGKILSAVSDQVRATVCQPLRSLTRQTGIDYRKDLGLSERDVSTIIGGALVDLNDDVDAGLLIGSGDPEKQQKGWVQAPLELDSHSASQDLDERIRRHLKDDPAVHTLVSSPLLVCTIDHMAALTDMRRSRYITAALRMLTADLVIDEADSYDERDIVALGRLVFAAGMCGRRVILSSATIPAPVAARYLKSYRDGYAAHAALFGKPNQVHYGMFSESVPSVIMEAGGKSDDQEISDYLNSIGQAARLSSPIRIARVMPKHAGRSREALFPAIRDELVTLHKLHGQEHPDHGKTMSFQLVRFSHVNPCVSLAQYLDVNQPDDYEIRYVVYHSRFPRAARDAIEKFMEATLKRKDGDNALRASPVVNAALSKCQKQGVIFVVIATAVLEIGRDVDFDAAVVEPCSMHSLIQVAGRVGRHRMIPARFANIVIMPTSMRRIEQRWPLEFVFNRPGSEGVGVDNERYQLPSPYAQDVMPSSEFAVTAALRLCNDDRCSMAELEYKRLASAMNGTKPSLLATTCSNEQRVWMSDYPARDIPFRESEVKQRVLLDPGKYEFFDSKGRHLKDSIVMRDVYCKHALLDLHPDVLFGHMEERIPMDLPRWLFEDGSHGLLHYVPNLGVVPAEVVAEERPDE